MTAALAPTVFADPWRVVLARDRRFDGAFVYAVRSTGIYCRPSCPSRRPRRAHVVFFPVPEVAERAGFRPCRRCRPRAAPAADPAVALARRVCAAIDEFPARPPALGVLARDAGMGPRALARLFRRVVGITPRQYREARRLAALKRGLRAGNGRNRVTPAMYDAGFGSPSRLYERARERLGMTPATYAHGGAGARIASTVVDSPLGRMLVAATPSGVCRVAFADEDAALGRDLRREFPAAQIVPGDASLRRWAATLVAHLEGRAPHLELPTDVRATAFQRLVWDALRRIPYGATRSYTDVARAIGRPHAVRAVARACATNPTAVVVPCHRVIRADGAPGGYRWGLERKARLLELELSGRPGGSSRDR